MQDHVVAGCDGSPAGARAAHWAAAVALVRDVPLQVLCAVPPATAGTYGADLLSA